MTNDGKVNLYCPNDDKVENNDLTNIYCGCLAISITHDVLSGDDMVMLVDVDESDGHVFIVLMTFNYAGRMISIIAFDVMVLLILNVS